MDKGVIANLHELNEIKGGIISFIVTVQETCGNCVPNTNDCESLLENGNPTLTLDSGCSVIPPTLISNFSCRYIC